MFVYSDVSNKSGNRIKKKKKRKKETPENDSAGICSAAKHNNRRDLFILILVLDWIKSLCILVSLNDRRPGYNANKPVVRCYFDTELMGMFAFHSEERYVRICARNWYVYNRDAYPWDASVHSLAFWVFHHRVEVTWCGCIPMGLLILNAVHGNGSVVISGINSAAHESFGVSPPIIFERLSTRLRISWYTSQLHRPIYANTNVCGGEHLLSPEICRESGKFDVRMIHFEFVAYRFLYILFSSTNFLRLFICVSYCVRVFAPTALAYCNLTANATFMVIVWSTCTFLFYLSSIWCSWQRFFDCGNITRVPNVCLFRLMIQYMKERKWTYVESHRNSFR